MVRVFDLLRTETCQFHVRLVGEADRPVVPVVLRDGPVGNIASHRAHPSLHVPLHGGQAALELAHVLLHLVPEVCARLLHESGPVGVEVRPVAREERVLEHILPHLDGDNGVVGTRAHLVVVVVVVNAVVNIAKVNIVDFFFKMI